MKEPNKKSSSGKKRDNTVLCPECGFPNRITDRACMYCHLPLANPYKLTLKHRLSRYLQQRKWRKIMKQRGVVRTGNSPQSPTMTGRIVMMIVGATLTLSGLAAFVIASTKQDLKLWLISILFLLYGVFTLIRLFKKK